MYVLLFISFICLLIMCIFFLKETYCDFIKENNNESKFWLAVSIITILLVVFICIPLSYYLLLKEC